MASYISFEDMGLALARNTSEIASRIDFFIGTPRVIGGSAGTDRSEDIISSETILSSRESARAEKRIAADLAGHPSAARSRRHDDDRPTLIRTDAYMKWPH
jgi:hypothetical protein